MFTEQDQTNVQNPRILLTVQQHWCPVDAAAASEKREAATESMKHGQVYTTQTHIS